MLLSRVTGTMVASRNADQIDGGRYLLVTQTDAAGKPAGPDLVALDLVGADRGQLVLVSQGSSARQTPETKTGAIDAVIVGIVDTVDVSGDEGITGEAGYQAR